MMKTSTSTTFNNGWCFALINNRLAEIFFSEKSGLYGYCYVKREEYSKKEQKIINEDTKNYRFSYRNKIFRDKLRKITFPLGEIRN
jgi:hypothetical protein